MSDILYYTTGFYQPILLFSLFVSPVTEHSLLHLPAVAGRGKPTYQAKFNTTCFFFYFSRQSLLGSRLLAHTPTHRITTVVPPNLIGALRQDIIFKLRICMYRNTKHDLTTCFPKWGQLQLEKKQKNKWTDVLIDQSTFHADVGKNKHTTIPGSSDK